MRVRFRLIACAALSGCVSTDRMTEPSSGPLITQRSDGPPPSVALARVGDGEALRRFSFLSPLGARQTDIGAPFDPELQPTVRICVRVGATCGSIVNEFPASAHGSSRVRSDARGTDDDDDGEDGQQRNDEGGFYQGQWRVPRNVTPSQVYRIAILVREPVLNERVEVGHLDVQVGRGRRASDSELPAITAGRTVPIRFRIAQGIVGSVVVEPGATTITEGETQAFTARVADLHGRPLTDRAVAWASSQSDIAEVEQPGLILGRAPGAATITATSDGRRGTATIQVNSRGLSVLPGLVGFGVATPAGRGGAILRVSTLADDGEGSLRAALSTPGVEPRVIVFEVSGTIVLSDNLVVEHPFVTIAGQTAPSPGITLRGAALQIATHDVLVQHLRIRVGDDPEGPRPALRDGLLLFGDDGRDVHNVVVDHVSVSWAIDENASTSTSGLRRDITIVNSIVSEGLSLSLHTEGEHSKGLLVGEDSRNIAVLRNLFAHNYRRNPEIKGRTTSIVANNLIYNSGLVAIEFNSGAMQSSIVGNVMILGPSTGDNDLVAVDLSVEPGSAIYLADNVAPEVLDIHEDLTFDPIVDQPPMSLPGLTILPSADVEEHVLVNAGARPADRDAVDLRIVAEVRARNGRIINSPAEVGGWPVLAENRHTLVIPQNPGGDDDADGYTNLEEWLHGLAAQVEGR